MFVSNLFTWALGVMLYVKKNPPECRKSDSEGCGLVRVGAEMFRSYPLFLS